MVESAHDEWEDSNMDGGGDEDEEWPDDDEEEEYKGGIDMDDIIITKNDKGYKAVKSDNIKH